MPLKLFKVLKQFVIATLMIKLTQFEKTGSLGKFIISLGNQKIKFHFRN